MGELPAPPVIGRDTALGELHERVRRAAGGSPSVVLVDGETGIGKTRLVHELVDADVATVCAGGCLPLPGVPLPFAPLIQSLRGLGNTGAVRQQVERSPDLARLLPTWTGADTEGVVTASTQLGLFQAVLELLERLGAARPVLHVIEDLHWADRSTLDLLRYLATNLTSERVVLLVTYRADGIVPGSRLAGWLAELSRLPLVHRLPLERLDREQTAALVTAWRGDTVDPGLLASVLERSAGNPMFVEQLLQRERPDAPLPDTLQDLMWARVAALPGPTRHALAAAAVVGRPATIALLARILDSGPVDAEAALRPALEHHVLRLGTNDTVAFVHPAFVEVVYGDLLPTARADLHRMAAQAFESRPGGTAAGELARHWLAAGDHRRALDAAVRAGAVAEEMYAFGDALSAYTRAVELTEGLGPELVDSDHDLGRLLARAAQSAHLVGDSDEAVRLGERALALTTDPDARLELYERLGSFQFIAGRGEQARDWFEKALEQLPEGRASARVAKVHAGLALLAVGWSRMQEAEQWAERGLAIAQATDARREEGLLRSALGSVAGLRGDFGGGIAELRRAVGIAEDVGAPDDLAIAYVNLTHLLGLAGRLGEVAEAGRRASETLTRMGMSRQLGSLLKANACEALLDSGRVEEARSLVADALSHEPRGIMAAPVLLQAGRLSMLLGDLELARDRCEQARLIVEADGAPDAWLRAVLEGLAEVELWSGRPEAAYERVVDGLHLITDTDEAASGALLVALGLRSLADQADRHRDAESLARLSAQRVPLDEAARACTDSGVPHHRALDAWAAAERARLTRTATAEDWAGLAEAWIGFGRPVAAAYARWREAEARLGAGADAAAVDALRAAYAAASELRAQILVRELERLARGHRLDLLEPPEVPSPRAENALAQYGLTDREVEVLGKLAAGRTNREIAEDLFISSKTASVHVSNILRKLEVSGRQEAARVAHRLGVGAP